MTLNDQTVKGRIVLLTAAFALVGFVLEIGPVGGVFALSSGGTTVAVAFTLGLASLGFLAYLALAASAAVGLHLGEAEPTPKEDESAETAPPLQPTGNGAPEQVRERVRPELHQLRMLFTALGGYLLLKGISLLLAWPRAQQGGITVGQLVRSFEFGFIFVALGWFVLWQFLRWYAQKRKWIRLQDELVGSDVTRVIAVIILLKPSFFLMTALLRGTLASNALNTMALLLHLALIPAAILLWITRPYTLRRTLIGLGLTGGVIILLTILLAVIEQGYVG